MTDNSGSFNPFEAPVDDAGQPTLGLNAGILDSLKQTRPWVLMMGVICFIFAALCVGGGAIFVLLGVIGKAGMPNGASAVGLAMVYVLMGVFYLFPGMYLMRYARRIRELLIDPTTVALEEALRAQKSFWKFLGISVLAMIGLYVLLIAGAILLGILSNL